MVLMPVSLLRDGMIVAKDIETNSSKSSFFPLIRKGVRLNSSSIARLGSEYVDAVYVEMDGTEDIIPATVIDCTLKRDALVQIEKIFKSHEKSNFVITAKLYQETNSLAKRLVENSLDNQDVLVSLFDLKEHDDYTYTHSLCVALLSISIGVSMGFDDSTLNQLATSAILHDIGKMAVPSEILNKPSVLTNDEFSVIKTHPMKGKEILVKKNPMVPFVVLSGIQSHHERYDGTGYPDGLQEDEIPLFAKIIAVGDVYDALTSNRPYRQAAKPCDAIEYIMGCANSHFDIQIINHFLKKVIAYPVGSIVQLSNGQQAIVVKNHPENIMRPVVRCINENGIQTSEIDLLNNLYSYHIVIAKML